MSVRHHIRPASSTLQDGKRILAFADSQLAYLDKIGSGDQWGTESISASDALQEKYKLLVKRSEEKHNWGGDWIQISILEVEVDSKALSDDLKHLLPHDEPTEERTNLPVAAMILEGRSSDYTRPVLAEQDERDPFVYVRYLVTDRRVGSFSKGSGQKLLDHANEIARSLGIGRLCLDGWNGNDYLLVRSVTLSTRSLLVILRAQC